MVQEHQDSGAEAMSADDKGSADNSGSADSSTALGMTPALGMSPALGMTLGTTTRREFIQKSAMAGVGAAALSTLPLSAMRPRRSANETIVVAVVGLNGRGNVHA